MQKKVVVYETKTVNELSIQNFSDQDVYVQSGDIVKGGQQDRMIGVDLIVPPRSGKLPVRRFVWSMEDGVDAVMNELESSAVRLILNRIAEVL